MFNTIASNKKVNRYVTLDSATIHNGLMAAPEMEVTLTLSYPAIAKGMSELQKDNTIDHEAKICEMITLALLTNATDEVKNILRSICVQPSGKCPTIKTVHFSGPCTVVIWSDGTKTMVRTQHGEPFDPEKGLAMAVAKKALGTNKNRSNYYDIFKKWIPMKSMFVPCKSEILRKGLREASHYAEMIHDESTISKSFTEMVQDFLNRFKTKD